MKINSLLAGTLALVIIAGLASPAFAQYTTGSGTPGLAGTTSVTITQQANQICNLIDFEGVGNLNLVGTIGIATFSAGIVGLVDSDAGGTGVFANEPSPDTVAIDLSGGPTIVTLSAPVEEVSFFYSAAIAGSVDFLDAGGVVLATVPMPVTPNGAGDPDPVTPLPNNTFLQLSHNAGFSNIKSVLFNLTPSGFVIDDFEYCEIAVGGELLPIDSTALILAGAQSFSWMIPVVLSVLGIGLFVVTRKNELDV